MRVKSSASCTGATPRRSGERRVRNPVQGRVSGPSYLVFGERHDAARQAVRETMMAIDIVPTKVTEMGIVHLFKECTERDHYRWWSEGEHNELAAVAFDGYYQTLPWDDFSTCAEAAFRNHIYAAVCSSVEEIAQDRHASFIFNHLVQNEDGKRLESFSIRFVHNDTPRFWIEFGENRAEAALRTFVLFLRWATT